MEQIDKADIQKFVNVFSQRHSKLDYAESNLENTLITFTEFFTKTDELIDGKKPTIPYHFRLENHVEFKRLSIPISRAMYSVPKVVMHMRIQLRNSQQVFNANTVESSTQPSMIINTGDHKQSKESRFDRMKNIVKKETIDPNLPEAQMQDMINDIQIMPKKWRNILHWYELGVRKRPNINTYGGLQGLLENIIIAFNVFIEPNLVSVVHHSNEITKSETELTASKVLEAYLKVSQQNANKQPFQQ